MNAIGRIGVVVPQIIEQMEYELMYGIHYQASKLGYDVLIFSDACNPSLDNPENDYILAQENIYQLVRQGKLDGILFTPGRYSLSSLRDKLYELLKTVNVPCLVLDESSDIFPSVYAPQRESMRMLTEHLIQEHGCKKIYCITGMKDHYISDERASGYRDAMDEAGLPVDDSMIFYGYFWKTVPKQLGRDIAAGIIPKPDAVVCASDCMATSLCEGLIENGMSVPEDILVTGYDGCWFTHTNTPSITTVSGREFELGTLAVSQLYEIMTGNVCGKLPWKQYIQFGRSCGCSTKIGYSENKMGISSAEYIGNIMMRYFSRKVQMYSNFISRMSRVDSMEQLLDEVCGLTYMLQDVQWLDICLCEDWFFDFENPIIYRQEGFSDKMLLVHSKLNPLDKSAPLRFSTENILPALEEAHEPQLIALTSLHHEEQIFGYIATSYNEVKDIFLDEHYLHWCDAVANGLNSLQRKLYRSYIKQQMEAISVHDSATGLYNKRGLMEQLPDFQKKCAQEDKKCVYMQISYVLMNSTSAQLGVDVSQIVANALRLSSDGNELICRLHDVVFAVILPVSDEDISHYSEMRITALEEKIRNLKSDAIHLNLITDYNLLQLDKISEADSFIEDKLQFILDKTESLTQTAISYNDQLYRLRRNIYSSPQNEWSISDVVDTLGVSVSHAHRLYKSAFGVSCHDDIITARIEKAKNLLLHTDLKIQEISDQCGYHNTNHFMRQFKERAGVTAMQFKKTK